MKHPRGSSPLRADSGPASLSLGRAAPIPPGLAQFLDTLGVADDPVWMPTHDNQEPPF